MRMQDAVSRGADDVPRLSLYENGIGEVSRFRKGLDRLLLCSITYVVLRPAWEVASLIQKALV
jgi:hypothetical protein